MVQERLITLACPSCGARQTLKPGSTSIVCEYCGNEYLVSPEVAHAARETLNAAQAAYSNCPTCHQGDRVEKVSAILKNQVQQVETTTMVRQPVHPNRRRSRTVMAPVSVTETKASALAQRLNHPPIKPLAQPLPSQPKPVNPDAYSANGKLLQVIAIGIAVLTVLCSTVGFLGSASDSSATGSPIESALCFLIPGLIIAVPAWLFGRSRAQIKNSPTRIANLEKYYQEKLEKHNQALDAHQKRQDAYQQALENWNNLYYCYRDDCVFVPGKGKAVPVEQMDGVLFPAQA